MVIVTGLAMISFVLLGAISDPRDIPTTLVIITLAAMAGGVAWLAGLQSGKASEWGVSGVLIGALVGVVIAMYGGQAKAVLIKSGDLSINELSDLRRQRYVANQFVRQAFAGSGERNQIEYMFVLPQYMFGFTSYEEASTRDVVLGELLRREADRIGLVVSDETVTDFINRLTGNKMTTELFKEIRTRLQVSEVDLLDALREEIKAREAMRMLYGTNYLTPETYWDFYRKLNVRQSAQVVGIPVDAFIDSDLEPVESELAELFAAHRENPPNFTPEGRPEEGRPGFLQPRRVRLAYLEAVYEDIEASLDPISEADIRKRYEEQYLRSMPVETSETEDGAESAAPMKGPALPAPKTDASATETPETPAPPNDGSKPETEAPKSESPAEPAKEDAKPEASPEEPASEKPADEAPAKEEPAEEASTPEESTEEPAPEGKEEAARTLPSKLQQVAFFDDEADASAASDTTPEPSASTEEKPADSEAEKSEAPAAPSEDAAPKEEPAKPADAEKEKKPALTVPPAPDAPATPDSSIPPAPSPTTDIRPLDDELKLQIEEDLLRERTLAEIDRRIAAAFEFMSAELGYRLQLEEEAENHLTTEQAAAELKKYAEEHGLVYVETPFLSRDEMRDADDYPVGRAVTSIGNRELVAEAIFQSAPADLYRPMRAENFITNSAFSYWKIADREAYAPESFEDEQIREQVVNAWRKMKAIPLAEARAQELAELVSKADKPMTEVLGEQTVTGSEDSLFLTVRETGEFTWMRKPVVPPTSMQQNAPVQRTVLPGLEDAGSRFMQTAFNKLDVDEVGVAPNIDSTAFYVIKINERQPTQDELDAFRERFLRAGMLPDYRSMAQQTLGEFSVDWVERLWSNHEVVLMQQ